MALCLLLQGCFGLDVPETQVFENYHAEGVKEEHLVAHVKCELHLAIQNVIDQDDADAKTFVQPRVDWIKDWGAQVSLKLTVDEKSNLSPGVTLNSPLPTATSTFAGGATVMSTQSFGLGLGGALTADATRTETVGFYFLFKDLLNSGRIQKGECRQLQDGALIESDLKIDQFIENKILIAESNLLSKNPSVKDKSPFNTFTYETSFVVSATGSVTPTWKLVRVTANPTGPFFGATRMRTDDLTITMGGTTKDPVTKKSQPSYIARDAQLASLIGQAVATAIQTQQH